MWRQVRSKYMQCKFKRLDRMWVSLLLVTVMALLTWESAWGYPSAGADEFDSAATVTIDLAVSGGPVLKVTVAGPTRIQRGDPVNPGDGRLEIDTEIVSLELHGISPIGPVTIRESGVRASTGTVKQQEAGVDFPADSFFDVFVEIETPFGTFHNNDPVRLQAVINSLPPWQAEYTPPAIIGVSLFDRGGRRVGVITHASHFVGQKPSFSVAPGGPSGLNAATIFDLPTAPRILPADLGLVPADDLDSLSYGTDYINSNSDLRFSVDSLALGVPGSAVALEAAKSPNEAHGDEFGVTPALPFGGSNVQILDESGDTAPPFPLLISDDVDALTEPPASFVDPDGDGVPDFPVYFSLDPGSPSIGTIPASPADILMSVGGAPPVVIIPEAWLGLVPGDDVDAICLEATTLTVLYSLAPGSPTLGAVAAGPADLFLVVSPSGPIATPPVFVPAFVLGLLPTDNLNALKCSLPEVDFFPFSLAQVVIEAGDLVETVKLSGPTLVKVAINPDGQAVDHDLDGREQVQTEMVQLQLSGMSSLGPVQVRLRDAHEEPFSGSFGEIEENQNNTKGILDLPPFTPTGSADSFFDIFLEVELGGQVYHTLQPKRMTSLITYKPPGPGEPYENPDKLQLYNEQGQPTGIFIGPARHIPNPPIRLHDFPSAQADLALVTPQGAISVALKGAAIDLLFVDQSGHAEDTDGDGLDQARAEIYQLGLTGDSPQGAVELRLRAPAWPPYLPSVGEIEESTNRMTGRLDLPPFASAGSGVSSFDMFVEVVIAGQTYHNLQPLRLQAQVSQSPPDVGEAYLSVAGVQLYDELGNPSQFSLQGLSYVPQPFKVIFLPLAQRTFIRQSVDPVGSGLRLSERQVAALGSPTQAILLVSAAVLLRIVRFRRRRD